MELLLISDSKLKITLSESEMKEFSLNADNIDYDNTETRKAFWSILDEAKHKTGFDAAQNKISVQIYTSKNGGCEMYVSKTDFSDGEKSAPVKPNIFCAEKTKIPYIFFFEDAEKMIAACKRTVNIGVVCESRLYAGNKFGYYMVISEKFFYLPEKQKKKNMLSKLDFLCEYGTKLKVNDEKLLNEHCRMICPENAVETVSKL